MKLAYVKGDRREAKEGLSGSCLGCGNAMIPVCGSKRAWHWRHKVNCQCDHWWENETEWHRNWKNHFPKECQEIRHRDSTTGEWHIADVKTKEGYILEFQHSYLKPEERQARNKFYGEDLVWVVDGLAKKTYWPKINEILKGANRIYKNISLFRLPSTVENDSLLSEWSDCGVPVFFDFGVDRPLLCLLPKSSKGNCYITPLFRQDFIGLHNNSLSNESNFSKLVTFLIMRIFFYENPELMEEINKVQNKSQRNPTQWPASQKQRSRVNLRHLNYLLRPQRPVRRRRRRL